MAEPADLVENEAELSGSDASSDSNDEEPEETEADRAFVVDGPVEEPDESSDSSDGSASSNDNEKDATSAPKKKRRREGTLFIYAMLTLSTVEVRLLQMRTSMRKTCHWSRNFLEGK